MINLVYVRGDGSRVALEQSRVNTFEPTDHCRVLELPEYINFGKHRNLQQSRTRPFDITWAVDEFFVSRIAEVTEFGLEPVYECRFELVIKAKCALLYTCTNVECPVVGSI